MGAVTQIKDLDSAAKKQKNVGGLSAKLKNFNFSFHSKLKFFLTLSEDSARTASADASRSRAERSEALGAEMKRRSGVRNGRYEIKALLNLAQSVSTPYAGP